MKTLESLPSKRETWAISHAAGWFLGFFPYLRVQGYRFNFLALRLHRVWGVGGALDFSVGVAGRS